MYIHTYSLEMGTSIFLGFLLSKMGLEVLKPRIAMVVSLDMGATIAHCLASLCLA